MFLEVNKYFEWEHSLGFVDAVYERVDHLHWFECVEFTDQENLTSERQLYALDAHIHWYSLIS